MSEEYLILPGEQFTKKELIMRLDAMGIYIPNTLDKQSYIRQYDNAIQHEENKKKVLRFIQSDTENTKGARIKNMQIWKVFSGKGNDSKPITTTRFIFNRSSINMNEKTNNDCNMKAVPQNYFYNNNYYPTKPVNNNNDTVANQVANKQSFNSNTNPSHIIKYDKINLHKQDIQNVSQQVYGNNAYSDTLKNSRDSYLKGRENLNIYPNPNQEISSNNQFFNTQYNNNPYENIQKESYEKTAFTNRSIIESNNNSQATINNQTNYTIREENNNKTNDEIHSNPSLIDAEWKHQQPIKKMDINKMLSYLLIFTFAFLLVVFFSSNDNLASLKQSIPWKDINRYFLLVCLGGLIIYIIFFQLSRKNVNRMIYEGIRSNLLERYNSDENGLSEQEIISKYSSIYQMSPLQFQQEVLPQLQIIRRNDKNIKLSEEIEGNKIVIIWEWYE